MHESTGFLRKCPKTFGQDCRLIKKFTMKLKGEGETTEVVWSRNLHFRHLPTCTSLLNVRLVSASEVPMEVSQQFLVPVDGSL